MRYLVSFSLCSLLVAGCAVDLGNGSGPTRKGSLNLSPSSQQKAGTSAIAQIGPSTLTLETLQERLSKQSPFVQARYKPVDKRKEFLDNQIRFEVLALQAYEKGIHHDAEVQEAVKKIIVQKLTRDEFDGRVKLSDVKEADMKAYYEKNQEEYNKPEMVRASMIRVAFGKDKASSQQKASKALAEASKKDKLKDRNHFKGLVAEYSDHEDSKKMGGDLRYLSKPELQEQYGAQIAETVWNLPEINGLTSVLEGKDGFYIFKKTGNRRPIVRTFEQVQNQIRNLLYRDKRKADFEAYVDELKNRFGVSANYDLLEQLVITGPSEADPFHGGHTDAPPAGAPSRPVH